MMGVTLTTDELVKLVARVASDIQYFVGSVMSRFRRYISPEKHNLDTSEFDRSCGPKSLVGNSFDNFY